MELWLLPNLGMPVLLGAGSLPFGLYALARWRTQHAGDDPQFGLKFSLAMFAAIAWQGFLLGTTLCGFAMVGSTGRSETFRFAAALLIASTAVWFTSTALIKRTNMSWLAVPVRIWLGASAALTSLFAVVAFYAMCVILLKRGSASETEKFVCTAALVYGAGSFFAMRMLMKWSGWSLPGAGTLEPHVAYEPTASPASVVHSISAHPPATYVPPPAAPVVSPSYPATLVDPAPRVVETAAPHVTAMSADTSGSTRSPYAPPPGYDPTKKS